MRLALVVLWFGLLLIVASFALVMRSFYNAGKALVCFVKKHYELFITATLIILIYLIVLEVYM